MASRQTPTDASKAVYHKPDLGIPISVCDVCEKLLSQEHQLIQLGSRTRNYRLDSQLIKLMLEANLSFSALLLAVMGIFVALYVRAQHTEWKFRFKVLLIICVAAFLVGIFNCSISLMQLIGGFPSASTEVFNLIVSLFFCEVAILAFAGLFLIITVVKS